MTGNIDSVLTSVNKAYPGLLKEQDVSIDVINVSGAIETLYIQSNKTVLNSPALQSFIEKASTFQYHMINSQSLNITDFGNVSMLTTRASRNAVISTDHQSFGVKADYVTDGLASDEMSFVSPTMQTWGQFNQYGGQGPWHASFLDDNIYLSEEAYQSSYVIGYHKTATGINQLSDATQVQTAIDHVLAKSAELMARMGKKPCVAEFVTGPYFSSNSAASLVANHVDGVEAGVEAYLSSSENFEWSGSKSSPWRVAPAIPGFSRVMFMFSFICTNSYNNPGNLMTYVTYVPGPADVDYIYGSLPLFESYAYGKKRITIEGTLGNGLASSEFRSRYQFAQKYVPDFNPYTIDKQTMIDALHRDVFSFRSANGDGTTLFGPPQADLQLVGTYTLDTKEVEFDGSLISVRTINVDASDVEWRLQKDWYQTYMNTGYGIFAPRVSNIRQNVLKQWSDLDYDDITLRRTYTPYQPSLTVLTLPEAMQYAKGRAKACKDNDWLDQIAIKGTNVTWKNVQDKEVAARPRHLWMNVSNMANSIDKITAYDVSVAVVYSKNASNEIVRTQGDVVTKINPADEDDLGVVLLDRYFNSKASVSGISWDDIYVPTSAEIEQLADSEFTFTGNVSFRENDKLIGFGSHIDSTKRANISAMTPLESYRLHIRNSVEFDKMSGPLLKVLSSFGMDVLIKHLKS